MDGEVRHLWRPQILLTIIKALVFGYFEQLFRFHSAQKIVQEMQRLKNLNELLPVLGLDMATVVLFEESVTELLEEMREALQQNSTDDGFLLKFMNEDGDSVVYYFKVRKGPIIYNVAVIDC